MIGRLAAAVRRVHRDAGWRGVKDQAARRIGFAAGDRPRFRTEYLDWLQFANPGMLQQENIDAFAWVLPRLPSEAPMLEIGSFCGLSANTITYLKQRFRLANPLFTCDAWEFEGSQAVSLGDSKTVTHGAYRDFVRESFLRNVRMFSGDDLPYTIETSSDGFFSAWSDQRRCLDVFGREVALGGPISFAYIDGDHSYPFARRDFECCDRHLEPGGFILFDDSADGAGTGAGRVAREIRREGRYELVSHAPNYLFRKPA